LGEDAEGAVRVCVLRSRVNANARAARVRVDANGRTSAERTPAPPIAARPWRRWSQLAWDAARLRLWSGGFGRPGARSAGRRPELVWRFAVRGEGQERGPWLSSPNAGAPVRAHPGSALASRPGLVKVTSRRSDAGRTRCGSSSGARLAVRRAGERQELVVVRADAASAGRRPAPHHGVSPASTCVPRRPGWSARSPNQL